MGTTQSVSCLIIGHGQLTLGCAQELLKRGYQISAIVSENVETQSWARENGIRLVVNLAEQDECLLSLEADYLFSIINPNRVSSKVLAHPKIAAINYHDAPLPKYAGLNVAAWAVINQEKEFGVTWHEMDDQFDAGRILSQRKFPLEEDETVLSLRVKCHQQGELAFQELLDQIETDSLAPQLQDLSQRSVFLSTARPDQAAFLDWTKTGEEIDSLVRGLTFGSDENPLGLPKILIGTHYFCVTSARLTEQSRLLPGTVISNDATGVEIATASIAVKITGLMTLEGEVLDLEPDLKSGQKAEKVLNSLTVGSVMPALTAEFCRELEDVDASLAQKEKFWRSAIKRSDDFDPFENALTREVTDQAGGGSKQWQFPESTQRLVAQIFPDSAARGSIALYLCYLSRLAKNPLLSMGLDLDVEAVPKGVRPLYAQQGPFNLAFDLSESVVDCCKRAIAEIDKFSTNSSFLKDLLPRTPSATLRSFPIRLNCLGDSGEGQAVDQLTKLVINGFADELKLNFPNPALLDSSVEAHCKGFETFAANALENTDQPLRTVSMLGEVEFQKVIHQWNDTQVELPSAGLVQDLIASMADQQPQAVALVFRGESITYEQMMQRVDGLSAYLVELGAKPDDLIGVYLGRSINMVVALLAILRSGGAYVPLDPGYPSDRIEYMVEDAELGIILSDSSLESQVPGQKATVVCVDKPVADSHHKKSLVNSGNLAYMIYTSGSTGAPKGVMVEHGNLSNFLVAMDAVLEFDGQPGCWLAVTSMSFDISVLELLWTLSRGFKVVVLEDNAEQQQGVDAAVRARKLDVGLFYFSSDADPGGEAPNRYRLMMEGARFADENGFSSVWTPERHFHLFGGLYPNPSVTSAALAAITSNVDIRAGSIVLPLHDPIRVAEEWSVVDNLSNGRVGLSFASGWHANDFVLKPENFEQRKQIMFDGIETVKKLWAGESITRKNGEGNSFTARIFPPPVCKEPRIWVTTAGNVETFRQAGEYGHNVLTNLLGQSIDELGEKIAAYRQGRHKAGHEGDGNVSVMVHTFVGEDVEQVREIVREPFCEYLKTSFDLVKIAPWAFPAFSQPSKALTVNEAYDPEAFTDEDMAALLEHAFDRYFETAGIFGTPESCLPLVNQLKSIGVDEVACLVDFGVEEAMVLDNLRHLARLRELSNPEVVESNAPSESSADYLIAAQLNRHKVTHFQCTPSMARLLTAEPQTLAAMSGVDKLLLGGEALPADLATQMATVIRGDLINVYGPTETTIWSSSCQLGADSAVPTIGKPIANTQVYILDEHLQPVPIGQSGELCIGGLGVVRGYFKQLELTAEKFVDNPFVDGVGKIYRTGDLAAWAGDGSIQFLGRLDHQVKLNGYRIELGEIESLINLHEQVAESVVVATTTDEQQDARLIAYVQPKKSDGGPGVADNSATVGRWHQIWDETYQSEAPTNNAADSEIVGSSYDTTGWLNSFTAEPHPQEQMLEWVQTTSQRILALKPKRVLEIGCGTGMLLYQIAPHCEEYVAVDFSAAALAKIESRSTELGLTNLSLINGSAEDFSPPEKADFDLVIINSVVQYFPTADYLLQVIKRAIGLLSADGKVFIGDVRSLPLLATFQTDLELARADGSMTVGELRDFIEQRRHQEAELVLDPEFFVAVQSQVKEIAGVNMQLRRGSFHNEMSLYRYDVLLQKGAVGQSPVGKGSGEPAGSSDRLVIDVTEEPRYADSDEIRKRIALELNNPESKSLVFKNIPNARLRKSQADAQLISSAAPDTRVEDIRAQQSHDGLGIEPEELFGLDSDYRIEVHWAEEGGPHLMDAYFSKQNVPLWANETSGKKPFEQLFFEPEVQDPGQLLIGELRARLAVALPTFMMPADFVVLTAMPLTPNGKIDRKLLPKPEMRARISAEVFVAPDGDLELMISGVFRDLLNLDTIGSKDNFFDIGANSLLIVQANSRLTEILGRRVPLVSMYRFPTIESLGKNLAGDDDREQTVSKASDRGARRKAAQQGGRRRAARGNRKN